MNLKFNFNPSKGLQSFTLASSGMQTSSCRGGFSSANARVKVLHSVSRQAVEWQGAISERTFFLLELLLSTISS
jgi:hypothetical protein